MAGINAIIYLLATVPTWVLVDRWGRRTILLSGAVIVRRRRLGGDRNLSDKALLDGYISDCNRLVHVHRHSSNTKRRCHLRHHLQCVLWIQLGAYPVALPSRGLSHVRVTLRKY